MVHQNVISSLSENQIHFLIYILNINSAKDTFSYESIKCIRVDPLRAALLKNKDKIKEEYLEEYRDLCFKFGLTGV
jgi:hypothetical protein